MVRHSREKLSVYKISSFIRSDRDGILKIFQYSCYINFNLFLILLILSIGVLVSRLSLPAPAYSCFLPRFVVLGSRLSIPATLCVLLAGRQQISCLMSCSYSISLHYYPDSHLKLNNFQNIFVLYSYYQPVQGRLESGLSQVPH